MLVYKKSTLALVALLVSVALKGAILAWFVPAWQQPDEPAHFQYAQLMVEERRLPVNAGSTLNFSPEVRRSVYAHGLTTLSPPFKMQLQRGGAPSQAPDRKVFGNAPANPAAAYWPLYYALVAIPYAVFHDAPVEHRLIAMRLISVLLFLGIVFAAYGIAFELRPRRGFALAVAAAVGWHPMAAYIFSGVNNDVLFTLLATLAFWLLTHFRNRRITPVYLLLIVALCIVGVLTKPPFIIFIPLFAFMCFRKSSGFSTIVRFANLAALVTLPLGIMLFWHSSVTTPNLPGITPLIPKLITSTLTVGQIANLTLLYRPEIVWKSFWGYFGWFVFPLHSGIYAIVALFVGTAVVGIIQIFRDLRRHLATAFIHETFFLLLSPLFLLEGLYLMLFWGTLFIHKNPSFPNQGRYYFPLLVPFIILCFVGIERLVPQRLHRYGAWGLAAFLLMLNIDALVVMLRAWA